MQPLEGLQKDKVFILTWAFVPTTVVFLWLAVLPSVAGHSPRSAQGEGLVLGPAEGGVSPGVAGHSPRSGQAEGAVPPGVAGHSPRSGQVGGVVVSAGAQGLVGAESVVSVGGEGVVPARAEGVISGRALADLRDLGAARGVTFVAVSEGRPFGLPPNDAALVDELEAELEQARTALSALEETNASARLRKVESDLLAHPHLPQASFLMGECLALQAQAAREKNTAHAAALDARRLALEGPRAASFGETAPALPVLARITLELQGLGARDEIELDGIRLGAGVERVTLVPGLHHARVWRAERLVFATFAQLSPEQTAYALDVPQPVPCSAEDLERVARFPTDERRAVPAGITCERWARVREAGPGIAVSMCTRSQCGPFLDWQRRATVPFAPIAVEKQRFPAWAGFALVGASALIASSVVLWQAGAFERGRPAAANWEFGGLNPQGLRF